MEKIKGPLYLFFGFSLAGTSVISARFLSGSLGTFTITSISLFFALLFLIPICLKELIKAVRVLTGSTFLYLMLQAMFGIFLFRFFLLRGILLTGTAEAGILTGATPAITAVLAILLLKEKATGNKLAGIIATVAGILLVQGLFVTGSGFSAVHIFGNVLVILAAACESAFNILSRISAVKSISAASISAGKKVAISPIVQTTIVSAIALIFCLIPALFEHPVQMLSNIGAKELLSLIWYGIFVTALAFILWYSGIKRCTAFTAAAFSGMMPFTSLILSVTVLGEHAGWQQWTGGILVIIGMILVGFSKSEQQKQRNETICN